MMQLIFRSVRLLAFATALAFTIGAAQAQSDNLLKLCGLMASTAGQFMEAHQDGVPRDSIEAILKTSKQGKVKEFMRWAIAAAVSVEVADSPAKASKAVIAFQEKVRFQCYAQDW